MALETIPGMQGFSYAKMSSFDKRAVGKMTDSNHLSALMDERPADYDKKILSIYTQSSLYSNDFLEMLNQSEPFYIKGGSDTFTWDLEVPYKACRIIEIPSDTLNMPKIGIDGQEFHFITDKNEFYIHDIVTTDKKFGQQFYILEDPSRWNTGWLYKVTLVTQNPKVDFVDRRFFEIGNELCHVNISVGEFDQELPGLPGFGDKMSMYETMGSAVGVTHKITGWADDRNISRGVNGEPLDLLVFMDKRRNATPVSQRPIRWEPYVEFLLRKKMMETKVSRMVWAKPGTAKTRGSAQEVKKISAGIYHRLRQWGNYVPYNRGEFSTNIFRVVFGDLFYRRVSIGKRKVKIYSNESGIQVFREALKAEALNSGFSFNIGDGNRFIRGESQNLIMDFAFSSMVSMETGQIDIVHLQELDLPQNQQEANANYRTTPIFIVFDISPDGNGTMGNNIREVRLQGRPSMTWGYIDGRRHHLGFAASKGHSAASKFDGYEMFYDDRYDFFIEDLSRCVLIEEVPTYF